MIIMKSRFILELEKGMSVFIEADSPEEAKKIFAQRFEKTFRENLTVNKEGKKVGSPKSLYDHLLRLKDEEFFSEPRTLNEIRQRLKELAVHYPATTFPAYLNKLVGERELRRFQEKRDKKSFWVYVQV